MTNRRGIFAALGVTGFVACPAGGRLSAHFLRAEADALAAHLCGELVRLKATVLRAQNGIEPGLQPRLADSDQFSSEEVALSHDQNHEGSET